MIRSEAEFEAALTRVLAQLDRSSAEGGAEGDELMALLADIRDYRPSASPTMDIRETSRADRLMAEAMALQERVDRERPLSDRLSDGFRGIGNSVTGEPR
jgi:hypothetical protein